MERREEIPLRRLYHLITGLFLVFILAHIDRTRGLLLILSLFVIAIIIEAVRLRLPEVNRIFFCYFNPLLRIEEERKPTGTAYYLGGMLFSLLLFDTGIALFSIAILAVGDPAASTIGKRWGKYRLREKSLEGSMAFLILSIVTGLILHRLWPGLSSGIIMAGALAGTVAELIPTRVNDNLLIPIVAAGAMKALSFFPNLVHLH